VFAAIGRFSYRHRWSVLIGWIALFVLGIAALPFLTSQLKGGGFADPSSPSERAAAVIQSKLGTGFTVLEVVFSSADMRAASPQFQAEERKALARIAPGSIPDLKQVLTYATSGNEQLISKDGVSSVAVLAFDASKYTVQNQVAPVREALVPTRLTSHVTGEPAVNADIVRASWHDLRVAESYAIPIALIALLLVFGTVVAAALPVISGGMAVTVTLGALYLVALAFDVSIFVMNVASLLGLAVGIDYALFMVARFREELAGGRSVARAVEATVARAGRSVFFSGLAVAVGILGLVCFPFQALRTIGIAGAMVVFFSVAAAVTLLPALFGILGPRVNSLRIVRVPTGASRFWKWWSSWVVRLPWLAIIVAVAIIALFSVPVLHMRTQMPTAAVLPASAESRQGYELLMSEFDMGALSPISDAVTWKGTTDPFTAARLTSLYSYGQQLAAQPGVKRVESIVNLPGVSSPLTLAVFWSVARPALEAGTPIQVGSYKLTTAETAQLKQLVAATTAPGIVVFRVVPVADPSSAAASALVKRLRTLSPPAGTRANIAGDAASRLDFYDGLNSRLPLVAGVVLGATFVILVLLSNSLVVPPKALIVNAFTILMAFGTIVYIFQDGHFESILRFTSSGAVDAIMPIIMFCALFGISMDYEVFLLARMHERWHGTHDAHDSVSAGLTQSGRVIVSAALLVVVVAGSFAFTTISMTKMLGIGIAVAILLDAFVVRMLLVPGLMVLLGPAAWWMPRALRVRLPDLGDEPGLETPSS
jgi:RND superfamily putative drug exporter